MAPKGQRYLQNGLATITLEKTMIHKIINFQVNSFPNA